MPSRNPRTSGRAAPLRVACIGGGPGGLFTAIALAHALPGIEVDVYERGRAEDVFGFGVVFSDATLDAVNQVDPVLQDVLDREGRHWDTIRVHNQHAVAAARGNGMAAVHRRALLEALRGRAAALGARLHYGREADVDALDASGRYDLIVAADGANSATRERFVEQLGHTVDTAAVKFIWFGTTYAFAGLTFLHERWRGGNFAVHGYPIGAGIGTFIVETEEATWREAGLDAFDPALPPGPSDELSKRFLEALFAERIDGRPLVANNSRWANFRTRLTQRWHTRAARGTPVVFVGDSVHTAHFSVGSGTKMAMEDAAALAAAVGRHGDDLDAAIAAFEAVRQPEVAKIQDSALPSLSWWDHFGAYERGLPPWQFGLHFFSRSISLEKMRQRDPGFVAQCEQAWVQAHRQPVLATPLAVGDRVWRERLLGAAPAPDGAWLIGDGATPLRAVPAADWAAGAATLPLFGAPAIGTTRLNASILRALDALAARAPAAVAIGGGNHLARVLCAEHLRLTRGLPAVIVDDAEALAARRAVSPADSARTVVLSGRADAVAFPAGD